MSNVRILSVVFLSGLAISLGTAAAPQALSQESSSPLREIHVDQRCHLLDDQVDGVAGMDESALPVEHTAICHHESRAISHHTEENIKDGVSQRSLVTVAEQEYLLDNVTSEAIAFVVEQPVPDEWQVDSDPQPTEMIGSTAVFRVMAQPGQIVRLHVGARHAVPAPEADSPSGSGN